MSAIPHANGGLLRQDLRLPDFRDYAVDVPEPARTSSEATRVLGVIKDPNVVRVYLPPDANCLLSVADHCLRSRDYVNVIVAGKQPALDYPSMNEAIVHCTRGLGIWDWASNDAGGEPDAVVCTGGVGEHAPAIRAAAAAGLGFLGVAVDPGHNTSATGDTEIGRRTLVVIAREDLEMARRVRALAAAAAT